MVDRHFFRLCLLVIIFSFAIVQFSKANCIPTYSKICVGDNYDKSIPDLIGMKPLTVNVTMAVSVRVYSNNSSVPKKMLVAVDSYLLKYC